MSITAQELLNFSSEYLEHLKTQIDIILKDREQKVKVYDVDDTVAIKQQEGSFGYDDFYTL